MKKVVGLIALSTLLAACSQPSNIPVAQTQTTFGAAQPSSVISVQQALNARDDSYVTLEGSIASQIGHEMYLFSDGTAQIQVEIDDEVWAGQNVGKESRIRISGEIDREFNRVELDVKQLTVLKP